MIRPIQRQPTKLRIAPEATTSSPAGPVTAARTEALLLDPVYTGKAMAGLIAAARARRISGTVVFWHTGGAPALFADAFESF